MIDAAAPAERILGAVIAHHDQNGWDLPTYRYVAAGQVGALAADCEHIAIALSAMHRGASAQSRGFAGSPAHGAGAAPLVRAEYVLRLLRCVAVADLSHDGEAILPSPEQIHADGMRLLADPGRLLDALYAWAATEPHNLTVDFGPIEPVGPEGGLAGHLVRVTLSPVQDVPIGGP